MNFTVSPSSKLLVSLAPALFCSWWLATGLAGSARADDTTAPTLESRLQAAPQLESRLQAVTVRLASGRVFTAAIDDHTDSTCLWLRWDRGSAWLTRPIRWDRVVEARLGGRKLSGEELRRAVAAVKKATPAKGETTTPAKKPVSTARAAGPRPPSAATEAPPPPAPETPRVQSLAIDASAANWDADVDVDGLVIHVYPTDNQGAVTPSRGTLEVELIGQSQATAAGGQSFDTLGRWTRLVRTEDFGPEGAVYRLPFQAVHPELDQGVAPYGAVHARLSVPGQGTFETTQAMVRVRPYSAVRDRLQQATGHRFWPTERTSAP